MSLRLCVVAWALAIPARGQDCAELARVEDVGSGTAGSAGVPSLRALGLPATGQPLVGLRIADGAPYAFSLLVASTNPDTTPLPVLGGTLSMTGPFARFSTMLDAQGTAVLHFGPSQTAASLCGLSATAQALVRDPSATGGMALTAGVRLHFGAGSTAATLFEAPHYYPDPTTNHSPRNVLALGDLDGNGRLDAIVPISGHQIQVLRQLDDGSLAPVQVSQTPGFLHIIDVAAGNLDGDGVVDVAGINTFQSAPPSTLLLAHGLGDGQLAAPTVIAAPPSAVFRGVAVGDVTGDGQSDVVASGWDASSAAVFAGPLGSLPAAPTAIVALPQPALTAGLRLADADGDGRLDVFVLVGATNPQVVVARSLGGGAFAAPQVWTSGLSAGALFDVADVDHDGDADAVVASDTPVSGDALTLLLNDGSGGLLSALPLGDPFDATLTSVRFGDLDDDDLPEIIGAHWGALPASLANRGGGTFGAPQALGIRNASFALCADMDVDGQSDLVGMDRQPFMTTLWWARGRGDGTLDDLASIPTMPSGPTLAADFDGDGDLDLVGWAWGDTVSPSLGVTLNDGAGGFRTPTLVTLDTSIREVVTGDLDGDGDIDIAATTGAGVTVLEGHGDGSFATLAAVPLTGAGGLRAADLDGDTLPELIVTAGLNPNGGVKVLPNLAALAFGAPIATSIGQSTSRLDVGDVNGDGTIDIVAQGGSVKVALGTGGFAFAPPLPADYGIEASPGYPVLLADLDLDGDLDIITRDFVSRTFIGLNDGSGGLTLAHWVWWDSDLPVSVADVNGDGAPDLVGDGVMLGFGDGSFAPPQPGHVGSVSGDLDGDGDLDGSSRGMVFLNRLW